MEIDFLWGAFLLLVVCCWLLGAEDSEVPEIGLWFKV